MTDNNKLKLAEQFSKEVQVTLDAERDYYSENQRSAIGVYEKQHFENEPPPSLASLYPEKCLILNNRKHPFQKFVDKQDCYKKALELFKRKQIFVPVAYRRGQKETPVINLEVILDAVLADTIIKWKKIQTKEVECFSPINKNHVKAISKKAKELLKAIDAAPDIIKRSIYYPLINSIESLAEEYDGEANPRIKYKRKLNTAHINISDMRYISKNKDEKAGARFLLRELVSIYMWKFGEHELISITEDMDRKYMVSSRYVQRCHINTVQEKDIGENAWSERDKKIIHADVLAELIMLVDDDAFINECDRTILRYAQRQRDAINYSMK